MTQRPHVRLALRRAAVAGGLAAWVGAMVCPSAVGEEALPASLSDIRASEKSVTATLVLRADDTVTIDTSSVRAQVGGADAPVQVQPATEQPRSTMLVIDTSGSMKASGMSTVRTAVDDFLAAVPDDVKVGVVSFATTSGVDVAPTTNREKVRREVASLRSKGETALYAGVQDAVAALGSKGERSIILLSDGGDTVANIEGGTAREKSQRKAALTALTKNKIRAEVVAFKSTEANATESAAVLKQFARAGGGSVANAADRKAVAAAFTAAARTLESQAPLTITRPAGVTGERKLVVTGTAGGKPFTARGVVDLGDTAPLPSSSADSTPIAAAPPVDGALASTSGKLLVPSLLLLTFGLFFLVAAFMAPAFRSKRRERVSAIEQYGLGVPRPSAAAQSGASGISTSLVHIGDRLMADRESTPRTMARMDRADLPWRAGEWLVIRIIAVLVLGAIGMVLFRSHMYVGLLIGALVGFVIPPVALRYLARRRCNKFEAVLPDVLMLVATSLSSGFSLLQALDAAAKDSSEPAAKEFSRALAEARIGSDVSDALEHMSIRMESENMRWTTMAIRIQRQVGGNLAETLRTTAATLREREMLRRQVRALSAEGRLSAYILIALPIGILLYNMLVNYDYIQLLWTTALGILMCIFGVVAMVIGIFWMRSVVKIEV